MLFNSYTFLFLFLPVVVFSYRLVPVRARNGLLAAASFVFYGYWDPPMTGLLLVSVLMNYGIGKGICREQAPEHRRAWLALLLLGNLALLGYFKYANFFLYSIWRVFPELPLRPLAIVLPVGISFFTFQGMSYGMDLYRGRIQPARNLIDFACYLTLFPQLIAGPIVRFSWMAGQLTQRTLSAAQTAYGARRFILGLSKKVLLADALAHVSDVYLVETGGGAAVWLGMTAFSLQIYFDFSGYSDMAIGLASLFGFRLPENFDHPYQARGLYDFWRRWHMTLSAWLRDYLYIPLGGSRCSRGRRLRNLLVTFLLCGLWHGADWTFVLWGGYHGLLLMAERPFRSRLARLPSWLLLPATNLLVIVGWVLFKAPNLDQARRWLTAMFTFSGWASLPQDVPFLLPAGLFSLCVACGIVRFNPGRLWAPHGLRDTGLAFLFVVSVVVLLGVEVSPFLYYQF